MNAARKLQPVIILGAPRSGTNMLRDLLTALPGVGTWDCDEINPIWVHGNRDHPDDAIPPAAARPDVKRFIRKAFNRIAETTNSEIVIEKTCANMLRVPFINAVFPDAKFIHIVRDGRDVTASAKLRWSAPFDFGYTLKKMRYVPFGDIPAIVSAALSSRLRKVFSTDGRMGIWGPRFPGFRDVAASANLALICAAQWRACVDAADEAFAEIEPSRIHQLNYEEFVARPSVAAAKLAGFIGVKAEFKPEALNRIDRGSVGSWSRKLSPDEITDILPVIENTLARHGYMAPEFVHRSSGIS